MIIVQVYYEYGVNARRTPKKSQVRIIEKVVGSISPVVLDFFPIILGFPSFISIRMGPARAQQDIMYIHDGHRKHDQVSITSVINAIGAEVRLLCPYHVRGYTLLHR